MYQFVEMKIMKRILGSAALLLAVAPAFAADIGVSVTVDQPGFYGSIDIGGYPRPRTVNVEPVIVQPVVGVVAEPVYMHVPPGQAKKWSRYCHQYQACGRPVYFVRDDWYRDTYVPSYRERHGRGDDDEDGRGRGEGRGPGHGNGHGHGHGHGRD